MIEVKLPRKIEKTDTPIMSTKEHMNLSASLLGARSPKPTVDKVVKAK
jgi:hypothetical protein